MNKCDIVRRDQSDSVVKVKEGYVIGNRWAMVEKINNTEGTR